MLPPRQRTTETKHSRLVISVYSTVEKRNFGILYLIVDEDFLFYNNQIEDVALPLASWD